MGDFFNRIGMQIQEVLAELPIEKLFMEKLLPAMIFLILGMMAARLISTVAGRAFRARMDASKALLFQRLLFYFLLFLALTAGLEAAGYSIATLMGAAGILTVALGFASQTSASNFISGLFLMGERPFQIGDTIMADGTLGEVIAIDLLSVKIRTFDNLFVRIPNESMIKTKTINYTKFAIRRFDMALSVAYGTNVRRVKEILIQLAEEHPHALTEPHPVFRMTGFGESGLNIELWIWAELERWYAFRTDFMIKVLEAFAREGIVIPFPQRTLHFDPSVETRLGEGRPMPRQAAPRSAPFSTRHRPQPNQSGAKPQSTD